MTVKTRQIKWKMIKILIFLNGLLTVFSSCASFKQNHNDFIEDQYAIIEDADYCPSQLFYLTLPYDELISKESFTYQNINENNYNKDALFKRYIDFDTVFSPEKRREITKQFRTLREVKLKKEFMEHPESLSKRTKLILGEPSRSRGGNRVTFPFIMEADNGDLYGFIFRYVQGSVYIYKKTGVEWERIAIVPIYV